MVAATETAEGVFIFHLVPAEGSDLHKHLSNCRQICKEVYGEDHSYLYSLHCSMTSYFACRFDEAMKIRELARYVLETRSAMWQKKGSRPLRKTVSDAHDIQRRCSVGDDKRRSVCADAQAPLIPSPAGTLRRYGQPPTVVCGDVVATETGYVIQDVASPFVRAVTEELAAVVAASLGICMRPKLVNHITLANDRGSDVRAGMRDIYQGGLAEALKRQGPGDWEVVMLELVQRSSLPEYHTKGPHKLKTILRLPLPHHSSYEAGGRRSLVERRLQRRMSDSLKLAEAARAFRAADDGGASGP